MAKVAPLVGAWIEISSVGGSPSKVIRSLPLWERGLKFWLSGRYVRYDTSLPLWERGLKYLFSFGIRSCFVSLPLWERGLKCNRTHVLTNKNLSLPLWERGLKLWECQQNLLRESVAPLVGAWIEISSGGLSSSNASSLPLWERGLKYI